MNTSSRPLDVSDNEAICRCVEHGLNQIARDTGGCIPRCVPVSLVRLLIGRAIKAERARAAAEEWQQWNRCFGPGAPLAAKARRDRILTVASSRALLVLINKPSSQES